MFWQTLEYSLILVSMLPFRVWDTATGQEVWDTATGQEVRTLEGHAADSICSVAPSSDDKTMASGSKDLTVR